MVVSSGELSDFILRRYGNEHFVVPRRDLLDRLEENTEGFQQAATEGHGKPEHYQDGGNQSDEGDFGAEPMNPLAVLAVGQSHPVGNPSICDCVVHVETVGVVKIEIQEAGDQSSTLGDQPPAAGFASQTKDRRIRELLRGKEYALTVISKSGTTTEPAVAFRLLRNDLEVKYGIEEAKSRTKKGSPYNYK